MPIYEYKCDKGHVFDVMQSFSDEPLRTCQICGAPVKKVLHPVAVHFKGSGFHNTDYGTRRRPRDGKESGEGSTASTDTAKTDTAAKPDTAKTSSSDGKAAAA